MKAGEKLCPNCHSELVWIQSGYSWDYRCETCGTHGVVADELAKTKWDLP